MGDEHSIVVDCDGVNFTLWITIYWSFNDIELLLFESRLRLLSLSRSLSWNLLESVGFTFLLTIAFDRLNTYVIDWTCVYSSTTCVTSSIKIDGYYIIRFGFVFIHVTDLYSFDFSANDISLSFLISFSFLLFTTWSMISLFRK